MAAEVQDGQVTASYLRGINLISQDVGYDRFYYQYNAHGDVVTLTDQTGSVSKSYDYTAFGIESDPDADDENPFRYCGEYYDNETGTYYLRARYYAPPSAASPSRTATGTVPTEFTAITRRKSTNARTRWAPPFIPIVHRFRRLCRAGICTRMRSIIR